MREGLDPQSKLELANLLLQIGFREEAIAELLAAASILRDMGETDEAASIYRRVLDLEPDNSTALRGLEEVAPGAPLRRVEEIVSGLGEETAPSQSGPRQPAETAAPPPPKKKAADAPVEDRTVTWNDFKAALKEPEDQPDKRLVLGERLLESGMVAEAQIQLDIAYRAQKTPRVVEFLARCFLKKGSYPRAVNLIKEGLKLPVPETTKLNLHYLLGTLYRNIDDGPRALDEFALIAAIVPDYRDVQEQIALLGGVIPKEGVVVPAPLKAAEVKPSGPAPSEALPSRATPPAERAVPGTTTVPADATIRTPRPVTPVDRSGPDKLKIAPSKPEKEMTVPQPALRPGDEEHKAIPREKAAPAGSFPLPVVETAPSRTIPIRTVVPDGVTPKEPPTLKMTAPVELRTSPASPAPGEPVPPLERKPVVTAPTEVPPRAATVPPTAVEAPPPSAEILHREAGPAEPVHRAQPGPRPPHPLPPGQIAFDAGPEETEPLSAGEPAAPPPDGAPRFAEPPFPETPLPQERYPVIEEPLPDGFDDERKKKNLPPLGEENITFL